MELGRTCLDYLLNGIYNYVISQSCSSPVQTINNSGIPVGEICLRQAQETCMAAVD